MAEAYKWCWSGIAVTCPPHFFSSGLSFLGLCSLDLEWLTAPKGEASPFHIITGLLAPSLGWQWKGWLSCEWCSWWSCWINACVWLCLDTSDEQLHRRADHKWLLWVGGDEAGPKGTISSSSILQWYFYCPECGGDLGVSSYGHIGLGEVQRHQLHSRKQESSQTHRLWKAKIIQKMFENSHLAYCLFVMRFALCFIVSS